MLCLLYAIKDKGDEVLHLDIATHRSIVDKKYLNYRYHPCMISLRDKLIKHGMVSNDKKALFSCFDFLIKDDRVQSIKIQISKGRAYWFTHVANSYAMIDLNALQSLSTFTAKALYCWVCRNKNKSSFWVKTDIAKRCLGINIHSTTADVIKIKNAIKSLNAIGIDLLVSKNKNINDRRSVFSLNFSYSNASKQNETQPSTHYDLFHWVKRQ